MSRAIAYGTIQQLPFILLWFIYLCHLRDEKDKKKGNLVRRLSGIGAWIMSLNPLETKMKPRVDTFLGSTCSISVWQGTVRKSLTFGRDTSFCLSCNEWSRVESFQWIQHNNCTIFALKSVEINGDVLHSICKLTASTYGMIQKYIADVVCKHRHF